MENVGSVIVGALIALVGTVVVQLWLIPVVESRKRREQRWEADVRALGELMVFAHPQAMSEVHGQLHWQMLLADPPANADPERLAEFMLEHEVASRSAWQEFDRIREQVDWLVGRISALAPASPKLRHFRWSAERLTTAILGLVSLRYAPDDRPITREALDDVHDAVYKATMDLLGEVKRLADGQPPRNSSLVRRKWQQCLSRIRKARAKKPV